MSSPIIINGVTYNSIDEMPPDVRVQYEALGSLLADKNQNGMPDIMEVAAHSGAAVIQTSAIVYQGKTYARVEDLPPEARAKYEQAMAQLADHNQDGAPDTLENVSSSAPVSVSAPSATQLAPSTPDNAGGQNIGPIVVLTVVALGLTAIIAILMFLLSAHPR